MKELIYKNQNLIILFFILAIGFFLRINNLTTSSFWFDELFSMDFSNPNRSFSEMIRLTIEDVHPPFYQLILWVWLKLFGFTEFSARFLSVLLGVGSIFVSYVFAKEFYNKKISLAVAFIFAINFFLIWYSQEARSYQLTVILCMFSYLYLYKFLTSNENKYIYFYWIITIIWMYTHYFSFFIIVTQFIFTLFYIGYFAENKKKILTLILITAIIFFISILPLLPYILEISTSNKFNFIEKPDPLYFLTYMHIYFGHGSMYFFLFLSLANIYFLILHKLTRKEKIFLSMCLIWIVFGYLLLYLKSVYSFSLVQFRYTIVIIPPIIILLVFGISKLKPIIGLITLLIFTIFSYKIIFIDEHTTYRQNFRDVLKYVSNYNTIPIYELELGNGHNGNNTNHFQVYSNILNLNLTTIEDETFKQHYFDKTLPQCFWVIYPFGTITIDPLSETQSSNSLENILGFYKKDYKEYLNIEFKKKYYKAEAALISTNKKSECMSLIKPKD